MEISLEQLQTISDALGMAEDYLYNDMDAICDDLYLEECENVLNAIREGNSVVDDLLHNKQ